MPIAWGVGPAIFPVAGIVLLLGKWEENRRKKRILKQAQESGLDVAMHNYLVGPRGPYYQLFDAKLKRWVRYDKESKRELSVKKSPGPFSNIEIRAGHDERFLGPLPSEARAP